jgi:hypothetical protein
MSLYFISPPDKRPHGFWYVSGTRGCGVGMTFTQALNRYMVLPSKGENNADNLFCDLEQGEVSDLCDRTRGT